MDLPRDFWIEEPTTSDDLPPLTDAILEAFHRRVALQLPPELVGLLRQRNGGGLTHTGFAMGKGEVVTIDDLMGVSAAFAWNGISTLAEFLAARDEDVAEWKGVVADPRRVLLLSGDGHWFAALDYGKAGNAKPAQVVHLELECGAARSPLAPSFAALLARRYTGDAKPLLDWSRDPGDLVAEDRVGAVHRENPAMTWKAHCRLYRRGKDLIVRCERWRMEDHELSEGVLAEKNLEINDFGGSMGAYFTPAFIPLNLAARDGMVRVTTCTEGPPGCWKSQVQELAYVAYDCLDQARADALRTQLHGEGPSTEELAYRQLAARAMEAMGDPAKLAAVQAEMMARIQSDFSATTADLERELAAEEARGKAKAKPKPRRRG
jgi:hypothetical protein